MDWNHYNGPQMTPEQIHAYLDRIACPGPIPLNLAGLTRLLQATSRPSPSKTWMCWLDAPYPRTTRPCSTRSSAGGRVGCAQS